MFLPSPAARQVPISAIEKRKFDKGMNYQEKIRDVKWLVTTSECGNNHQINSRTAPLPPGPSHIEVSVIYLLPSLLKTSAFCARVQLFPAKRGGRKMTLRHAALGRLHGQHPSLQVNRDNASSIAERFFFDKFISYSRRKIGMIDMQMLWCG